MFGKRANRSSAADNEFPEDDFDQSAQADMAEATDEWADGDDSGSSAAPAARGGSGLAKLIPFVAIGLAAAGGAGYFYMNHMAPKAVAPVGGEVIAAAPTAAPETMVDPSAEVMPTEETDTAVAAAPELATPETPQAEAIPAETPTDEPAPVELTQDSAATAEVIPAEPEASPVAADPVVAETAEPLVAATDAPVVTDATPLDVAPVEAAPVAEAAAVAAPEAVAEAPVIESVTETPEAPQAAEQEPALEALTAPAPVSAPVAAPAVAEASGDVTMRLSVVEHQMSDVAKAVDALVAKQAGQSSADLATQVTALEAQVKALQSELRDLRSAPRTVGKTEAKVEPKSDVTVVAPKAEKSERAAKPAVAPAPAKSNWVLRAAQAGEAWVSRGAQGSLQSVKVGDSLPGIGRVTAISQRDGVWVVVGTNGSLRQ